MIGKPSEKEEEYFKKLEVERKKKKIKKGESSSKEPDICPQCGGKLILIKNDTLGLRQCQRCKGVWVPPESVNKLLQEK